MDGNWHSHTLKQWASSVLIFSENKSIITPYVDTGYRYPIDILEFNRVPYKQQIHPTQKPVDLLEFLIKTYTNENDTVLDNCMGSGSTGVACVKTNRNFIGIEKDSTYFNIAQNRINEAQLNWASFFFNKLEFNNSNFSSTSLARI